MCHHAIYFAEQIEDYLVALTARARLVVLEVSSHAPPSGLNPLRKAIHGVERPDRVVADEMDTVLASMGVVAQREDVVLPATGSSSARTVTRRSPAPAGAGTAGSSGDRPAVAGRGVGDGDVGMMVSATSPP